MAEELAASIPPCLLLGLIISGRTAESCLRIKSRRRRKMHFEKPGMQRAGKTSDAASLAAKTSGLKYGMGSVEEATAGAANNTALRPTSHPSGKTTQPQECVSHFEAHRRALKHAVEILSTLFLRRPKAERGSVNILSLLMPSQHVCRA